MMMGKSCRIASAPCAALTFTGFSSHSELWRFSSVGRWAGSSAGHSSEKESFQSVIHLPCFVLCSCDLLGGGGRHKPDRLMQKLLSKDVAGNC